MKTRNLVIALCVLITLVVGPVTGASAAPQQASIPPNLKLTPVLSGLTQPIFATHAGDGSGRLFIAQQTGQILIWNGTTLNATPFLDVSSIIKTDGGEQGLLGLAFDPGYASNGYFYITYSPASNPTTDPEAVLLARYHVPSGTPNVADASSKQVLLEVGKNYQNHNGGMLAFGPDGYLYMSTGDGGNGGDPDNNGQNKNALLGKILRLDVSTVPYTIPPTNPYYGSGTFKQEIWAYGLRNPWRFSFDKSTGDLYIGDVGQNVQEEVDYQAAGAAGGQNYGWRIREGNVCYNPSSGCGTPAAYVAPVATYNHNLGCAVTGGYVYRGTTFPGLVGVYLYADYCTGNLWGLYKNASNQWVTKLIKDTNYNISSFAEDQAGELYLLDLGGQLIHITQSPILSATLRSTATLDGQIAETSETSGLGGTANASQFLLMVGDTTNDRQVRAILSFNTSGLPNTAVITSAKLRIKKYSFTGGDPFAVLGQLIVDVGMPTFGGNPALQSNDFQAGAGYNRSAVFSGAPVANWYSASIVQPSFSKISLTATTQFRLRFTVDDNDNNANNLANFLSGDAGTDKPELIINYYVP